MLKQKRDLQQLGSVLHVTFTDWKLEKNKVKNTLEANWKNMCWTVYFLFIVMNRKEAQILQKSQNKLKNVLVLVN